MATVTVEVNGRPYPIGCADGQEDRVQILANRFDDHVRQVAADVGSVGDLRLFLMAALLVADELVEARAELTRIEHERGTDVEGPEHAALTLNVAAERIEKLLVD